MYLSLKYERALPLGLMCHNFKNMFYFWKLQTANYCQDPLKINLRKPGIQVLRNFQDIAFISIALEF